MKDLYVPHINFAVIEPNRNFIQEDYTVNVTQIPRSELNITKDFQTKMDRTTTWFKDTSFFMIYESDNEVSILIGKEKLYIFLNFYIINFQ